LGISEVINNLQVAKIGSRRLDVEIATIFGWRKGEQVRVNPQTGVEELKPAWLMPHSELPGKVPFYTSDLQAAYELAQELAPGHVGGVYSGKDSGRARIGLENPIAEAANAALALCIAALQFHLNYRKEGL